jgi:hypothetical protein
MHRALNIAFGALYGLAKFTIYLLVGMYLFAYIEFESPGQGCLLGGAIVLVLPSQKRFTALVIYIFELCALYLANKYLSYAIFSVLAIYWAYPSIQNKDDVSEVLVTFKPFETDIRQFLMRKDPMKLHLVDDMLEKYGGDGESLLEVLTKEYQAKEEEERQRYVRNVVHRGFS